MNKTAGKNPEGGDAGYRAEKFIPQVPFHVFDLLQVHAFSFGSLSDSFAYAATLGFFLEALTSPLLRSCATLDERVRENPVQPEVRVPPNRRREVCVPIRREAVVAEVSYVVTGPAHGPEDHGRDEFLFRPPLDLLEHRL